MSVYREGSDAVPTSETQTGDLTFKKMEMPPARRAGFVYRVEIGRHRLTMKREHYDRDP